MIQTKIVNNFFDCTNIFINYFINKILSDTFEGRDAFKMVGTFENLFSH